MVRADWQAVLNAASCQTPSRSMATVTGNGPPTPEHRLSVSISLHKTKHDSYENKPVSQLKQDHGIPYVVVGEAGVLNGRELQLELEGSCERARGAAPHGTGSDTPDQSGVNASPHLPAAAPERGRDVFTYDHWVQSLVSTAFFSPCTIHCSSSPKNRCNFFCPSLSKSMCQNCVGHQGSPREWYIQVYRYMYNDIIRVEDNQDAIDLQGIQPYMANGHAAVHLRPWEVSRGKSPAGFNQRCRGECGRRLSFKWLFCSLACKMNAAEKATQPTLDQSAPHAPPDAGVHDALTRTPPASGVRHSTSATAADFPRKGTAATAAAAPSRLHGVPTPGPPPLCSRAAFEAHWLAAARRSHSGLAAGKEGVAQLLFASVRMIGEGGREEGRGEAGEGRAASRSTPLDAMRSPLHASPSPTSVLKTIQGRDAVLAGGSLAPLTRRPLAPGGDYTPPPPSPFRSCPPQEHAHALAKTATLCCVTRQHSTAQRSMALQAPGGCGEQGPSPRKRVRKLSQPESSPTL